jgi:chloramphenicol-sensitive protein RarD
MFVSAARRIPLTMISIMRYVALPLQFLIGVMIYKEPFASAQLIGFSMVWLALIIFWVEGLIAHRAQKTIVEVA